MLKFEELYSSYSEEVYRFAFWLSGNNFDAEDITSETFIRAWVRSKKIHTETLKAYLFTIARNVYLDHQRKTKRQTFLDDVHPDPESGIEKKIELQQEIKKVQGILQSIPEIDRAAFVLSVQHGLPYEEISRVLELSLSHVKVKIHRVRKKLFAARLNQEEK